MNLAKLFILILGPLNSGDYQNPKPILANGIPVGVKWAVIKANNNGTPIDQNLQYVVFKDGYLSLRAKTYTRFIPFKLDTSTNPTHFDVADDWGKCSWPGIYTIDGPILKISWAEDPSRLPGDRQGPRPKDFTSNVGDKKTVLVLRER
jgi:uncharacterized protein (TIGR03067 family)